MIVGPDIREFIQVAFRGRYWWAPEHNNTGWIASRNTDFEWEAVGDGLVGDPRGLRLRVAVRRDTDAITLVQMRLRYSLNGSAFTSVNLTSDRVRIIANDILVHGDHTTDFFGRIGTSTNWLTTNKGQLDESTLSASSNWDSVNPDREAEFEWSFVVLGDNLDEEDNLQFEVWANKVGSSTRQFNTYFQRLDITVKKTAGNPPAQTALDFKAKNLNAVYVDFGSKESILADIKSTPSISFNAESSKAIDVDIESKSSITVSLEIH